MKKGERTGQRAEDPGDMRQPLVVTALRVGIQGDELDDEKIDEPAGERAEQNRNHVGAESHSLENGISENRRPGVTNSGVPADGEFP